MYTFLNFIGDVGGLQQGIQVLVALVITINFGYLFPRFVANNTTMYSTRVQLDSVKKVHPETLTIASSFLKLSERMAGYINN